jgi:L-cysteine desulfidase
MENKVKQIPYEQEFLSILKEELVPALGCTEPIAIAFGSAKARTILGDMPDKIIVKCSGPLIKNIKSVRVPNTDGLVGIEASVMAGLVGGDETLGLEVLSSLKREDLYKVKELIKKKICMVELLPSTLNLHFIIRFEKGNESSEIEVKDLHTNITRIKKNDSIIFEASNDELKYCGVMCNRSFLSVENIVLFSEFVDIDELKKILSPQISFNMAIANEGLKNQYGVSIGNAILKNDPSVFGKMKAYASAASEARMCGSDLPVITNSGSGNQGIAASVPVIVYARELGINEETMYRALSISNLLTIYQKSYNGRLSAFCGAMSASCGSGAAITYLAGGNMDQIKMTVTNSLADASGIVCDGAKASCASKIASSLESAFIGHYIAMDQRVYPPSTGIVGIDADDTIKAVGRIASEGMSNTNDVILDIMLKNTENC